MTRIVGLLIAVALVVGILIFFGFIELSPDGEAALEDAQQSVGEAVENTGEALQGAGAEVQEETTE